MSSFNLNHHTGKLVPRFHHRIGRIDVKEFPESKLENVLAAMHQPFPALIFLQLWSGNEDELVSVIPDSFLGGFAPHLQTLILDHFPFPRLPNLLLSATHLVEITLFRIPYSVYLPPEMMVRSWSTDSPYCPGSKFSDLNSNHLKVAMTGIADLRRRRLAFSSRFLPSSVTEGSTRTWKDS